MTKLMKRYETETGKDRPTVNIYSLIDWYESFSAWLADQLTWRPVSEKPKENVSVEVCDLSKSSLDEREPEIGYYENGEWFCIFPYDLNIYKKITPTHWRYIPPAPEGE